MQELIDGLQPLPQTGQTGLCGGGALTAGLCFDLMLNQTHFLYDL